MPLTADQRAAVYERAAELLSAPDSLSYQYFARRMSGACVDPTSADAIQFCARGAICRAHFDLGLGVCLPRSDVEDELSGFAARVLELPQPQPHEDTAYTLAKWSNRCYLHDERMVVSNGLRKVAAALQAKV